MKNFTINSCLIKHDFKITITQNRSSQAKFELKQFGKIINGGDAMPDIFNQIRLESFAFVKLRDIMKNKELPLALKRKFLK